MGRQLLGDQFGEIVTLSVSFAHRETADGQAIEGQFAQECGAHFSQLADGRHPERYRKAPPGIAARV